MGLWYWELMSRPDPAVLPVGTLHPLEWFWVSRRIFIYSHHNTYVFSLRCPSVRPSVWRGFRSFARMHRGIGLKFYMLVYLHHLQNWLVYGRGLVILGFPGISWRTHGGNDLKCCMLMYRGHLQNWLVYGHILLIFLILALFWLSEMGQIWGFRAFPGERMEEITWNFARWCILSPFRTD